MMSEILDEILNKGNQYFSQAGEVSVGESRKFTNPGSTTYRIELLQGNERLVIYVKTLIPGRGVNEKIREDVLKEYDVLSKLYEGFSGMQGISVVKPLAVFPEYSTIVTREAPGPTLQHRLARATRLWASPRKTGRVGRYCYLAGKWLNRFQQLTCQGKVPFSADDIRHYCNIRLSDLVAQPGSGIDERMRQDVLDWIEALSSQTHRQENMVAGCHNDYAPHNMIAGDDRLCVLDLGFFNYDSTVYDVCRFWHRLETFGQDPLVSRRCTGELQERFLAGYGQRVDRTGAVFRLAECRYALSSMCTLQKWNTGSFARRRLNAYLYNSYLDWLKRAVGSS
jgi:hypothetical protein